MLPVRGGEGLKSSQWSDVTSEMAPVSPLSLTLPSPSVPAEAQQIEPPSPDDESTAMAAAHICCLR